MDWNRVFSTPGDVPSVAHSSTAAADGGGTGRTAEGAARASGCSQTAPKSCCSCFGFVFGDHKVAIERSALCPPRTLPVNLKLPLCHKSAPGLFV